MRLMRDQRRERREARDAERDRQDREAAARLASLADAPLTADGACSGCGGRQFRPAETAGEAAIRGFLGAGLVGSLVAANQGLTQCAGCGKTFRKG